MKQFVILSDLHLHPWSAFAKGEGKSNSRLLRSLEVLRASLEYARQHGLPWFFPGDIVHTAGYGLNEVLSALTSALSDYDDVFKAVVWGNHDARGKGGLITLEETVFGSLGQVVPNLFILNRNSCWTPHPHDVKVYGEGYQPRADLIEMKEEATIGLFHQTVRGSLTPTGFPLDEGIERDKLLEHYQVSIVGHVHHPQNLGGSDDRLVLIPGSPEHHNFGDKGAHGWWILTLEDGPPRLEFIPGGSPEFRTVESPREVKDDGHYYRVRTLPTGEILPANASAISPQPTVVEERNLLRGASQVEEILAIWLKLHPPEEPSWVEHSDDCPVGLGQECACPALNTWDLGDFLAAGRTLLEAQDPVRLQPWRLTELHLHNFQSYEDQEFPIPTGIHLVVGEGRDFPSNGAGKTTLVGEALYWLLYDDTTKGLAAADIVRRGEESCWVEGILRHDDGSVLTLRRVRERGAVGLTVVQDGTAWESTGSRDMTTKLLRYLGLSSTIHQNLGYFSQEKILLFSSATDGKRKEVLSDLVGASAYQEASSAAAALATKYETERDKQQALLSTHSEIRGREIVVLQSVKSNTLAWDAHQSTHIQRLQDQIRELEEGGRGKDPRERLLRLQNRKERLLARFVERLGEGLPGRVHTAHEQLVWNVRERIKVANDTRTKKVDQILKRFASWDAAKLVVSNILVTKEAEATQRAATETLRSALQSVREQQNHLAGERVGIQREKEAADKERKRVAAAVGSGTCPSCGQMISDEHRDSCLADAVAKVKEVEGRLDEVNERMRISGDLVRAKQEELTDSDTRLSEVRAFVETMEEARRTMEEIDSLDKQVGLLKEQIAGNLAAAQLQANEETRTLLVAYSERKQAQWERAENFVRVQEQQKGQDLARLSGALEQARLQQNPHLREQSQIETRIESLNFLVAECESAVQKAQVQMAIHEYWKRGFSKQGIQSLLMEEIAILFNKNRGDIFPVLTQGVYDVQFSTVSTTRSGELREKTEFLVYHHGELIPYESLSGGQRRRVDLGVMLVMAQSVSEWMGVHGILGILTLDEVFGFLDDSGSEGLVAALEQVQKQIPTIFPITHDPHLQSLIPNVIRVKQDEQGISRIVS